jgi:cyclic pyranopterin phosphate synthase
MEFTFETRLKQEQAFPCFTRISDRSNRQQRMKNDKTLSHLDSNGNPTMVNVGEKPVTHRLARARAVVELGEEILSRLQQGELQTKKGAVFQTAILAGIMAAKKTGDLIPLCHPLGLEDCQISITPISKSDIAIECTAELHGKTGVEMEALTGATLAALTIYDMCKALSHSIVIKEIKLIEKRGGKSDFKRED